MCLPGSRNSSSSIIMSYSALFWLCQRLVRCSNENRIRSARPQYDQSLVSVSTGNQLFPSLFFLNRSPIGVSCSSSVMQSYTTYSRSGFTSTRKRFQVRMKRVTTNPRAESGSVDGRGTRNHTLGFLTWSILIPSNPFLLLSSFPFSVLQSPFKSHM